MTPQQDSSITSPESDFSALRQIENRQLKNRFSCNSIRIDTGLSKNRGFLREITLGDFESAESIPDFSIRFFTKKLKSSKNFVIPEIFFKIFCLFEIFFSPVRSLWISLFVDNSNADSTKRFCEQQLFHMTRFSSTSEKNFEKRTRLRIGIRRT
jgi:hypothetical protein